MLNILLMLFFMSFNSVVFASTDFKNDDDKISYALGFIAGEHLKNQSTIGIKVNTDIFMQGFKDNIDNKSQIDKEEIIKYLNIIRDKQLELMKKTNPNLPQTSNSAVSTNPQATNPANISGPTPGKSTNGDLNKPTTDPTSTTVSDPSKSLPKTSSINMNKEITSASNSAIKELNKSLINSKQPAIGKTSDFLSLNKQNKAIKELKSGLQYQILATGNQKAKSPLLNDQVKVHYRGTLTNGTEFDSSYQRQPAIFPLKAVIKGWQEALMLMKPNAKWKIFIPPHLAYGTQGSGIIPPNSVLIFDVELLEVNPNK